MPRPRAMVVLVRGQVDLPEGPGPARGGDRYPVRAPAGRDRRAVPVSQPVRGKPNQPANVVATAQALAVTRRVPYDELERAIETAPRPCSDGEHPLGAPARAGPELPRRSQHPRRDRAARRARRRATSCSRSAAGRGAVRAARRPRGHLHVVELDDRLRGPLSEAVAPFRNVTLHFSDALESISRRCARRRTRSSPTSRTGSPRT